jgi:hypothetical protein
VKTPHHRGRQGPRAFIVSPLLARLTKTLRLRELFLERVAAHLLQLGHFGDAEVSSSKKKITAAEIQYVGAAICF